MDAAGLQQLATAEQLLRSDQLQDAYVLLKRLHKQYPKHAETMMVLAFAERMQQHWPEAIALLKKACALAPDNLVYPQYLAMALMFSNEGRNMLQAITLFEEMLPRLPELYEGGINLLMLSLRNDLPLPILETLAPTLQHPQPDNVRLHYASACAIAAWLTDDPRCSEFVSAALGRTTRGV